jgi:predicted nucleic acid-binding Zn ribbon protein
MSDPPPETCEACGVDGQMTKLLSRTSFKLKGSGWYSQGYEGTSNRQGESSSAESATAPSSGESSGANGGSTGGQSESGSSNSSGGNTSESQSSSTD